MFFLPVKAAGDSGVLFREDDQTVAFAEFCNRDDELA